MAHRILEKPSDVEEFARLLATVKLPITVEWRNGRDRTLDQNALQWLWATEAAHQLGDRTADEVRHEWKLHHGVPILREEDAQFREVYDRALKPLPYELKVEAMRYVPVTSLMKVSQMVRYLDAVSRQCAQNGVVLTEPDPDLAKYQARHRTDEPTVAG